MITANEAAAQFLSYYYSPTLFRVHDTPDSLKLVKFFDIYKTLGYKPPEDISEITPRMLAKAINKIKGTVHEQALSTLLLRSLKLAIYSPSNAGHFALASDDYTHFTSPIRRYPDLLVHRAIKNMIDMDINKINQNNVKPLSKKTHLELNKIGAHCSFAERNAERAERELTKWRQLRYLKDHMGEVYKALIIDVRTHGLNIEIDDYYLTGNIHIADLYDDYYHYDERRRIFVGEKTHKTYKIGQRIEVLISKIDIHARKVEFAPVGLDIRRKRKKSDRKSGRRFH
jgi:ribonuclease R